MYKRVKIMNINNSISVSKKHSSLLNNSDVYLEEIQRKHKNHPRPHSSIHTKQEKKKTKLNVLPNKTFSFLMPEGYEKLFITIYALTLPYIAGLIFLFFYISKSDLSIFTSICDSHSSLFTWCIGYEIVAVILLLLLMKQSISFIGNSKRIYVQKP